MSQFAMTAAEQEGADLPNNYEGQDELVKDEHGDLGADDDQEFIKDDEDASQDAQDNDNENQDDNNDDEQKDKNNDDDAVNLDDIEIPDITGADSKLEKLTSEYTIAKNELSDLQQKWDDGELTEAEYNIETSALERKMARLEGKIEAAEEQAEEEAAKIERYNQQVKAVWDQEEKAFFEQPENKAFLESPRKLEALNKIVTELQQNPNLTPKDFNKLLKDARNSYVKEFGEFYQGAKSTPSKPAKPQPKIPQTLGNVPAALPNTDGNKFAHLDKLSGKDYEAALAKLSPEDQEAYLRS